MPRAITLGLPLLTLAVFAFLAVTVDSRLIAEADNALPLDMRVFGYTLGEGRGYLRTLSPAGFALYDGPVTWIAMLLPLLVGLTLALWMRPFAGVFGMVCVLTLMSYVALDWAENATLQAIMQAGPDWVQPIDVARASIFTTAKFSALGLALVLAARQGWRRIRR